MRPWLCSNDHPREAGRTSATPIATAHRSTIARTPKLPTFLLYSTVPVAQSAAVSLNQEHHGAPLLNCSGLVLVRQLIERLGVASAIDAGVRVLRRCKWYRESDHILTLIYSMFSGGSKLQDVNRLGQDDALKRVLGSDRIPHATTIGKFLWRFGRRPARQAAAGTGRVAGHDGGSTAGSVRDAAPRAAQGSDAGLGLVDP